MARASDPRRVDRSGRARYDPPRSKLADARTPAEPRRAGTASKARKERHRGAKSDRDFPLDEGSPLLRTSRRPRCEEPSERLERHDLRALNEAIIEFGEEGRFLGILLEGEVEVSIVDDGGQRHRLGVLKAGDVFGEMVLDGLPGTSPNSIAAMSALPRPPASADSPRPSVASPWPSGSWRRPGPSARKRRRRRATAPGLQPRRGWADFHPSSGSATTARRILVINCGSSSLKYNLYDTADERGNARGTIERIGGDGMVHKQTTPAERRRGRWARGRTARPSRRWSPP